MKKAVLYYATSTIIGGILGAWALSSILSGSVNFLSIWLLIGGLGMVFGVMYEVFLSNDPTDSLPSDRRIWIMSAFTMIALVTGIWTLVV